MLPKIELPRRTFLMGLGRFAVAAEVARHLPASAYAGEIGGPACPPPSAWNDLAKALEGSVVRPEDPFFRDYCRPNNLRYGATLPTGIARVKSAKDVQACLAWVKKLGAEFAVRSGGHNYAGYSTTKGLLIDMSAMAGATPGNDGLVTVKGGTLNSGVYTALDRLGRTLTHGRCTGVGAAGFLLGGGIGFNMRKYGMASDLLHATELVTANGDIIPTNASNAPELFWACRGGGGGNFGINTSFTVQTFPVSKVTVFNLTWKTNLKKVVHLLLTELAEAPDDFGSKISVTMPSYSQRCAGEGITVSVLGQLHPNKMTLKEIFKSTWEMADTKEVKEDVGYWEGQDFLAETVYPYFYQEKSSFMVARDISEESVAAMFDWAEKMPPTSMATAFKFFQVGGAINKTKPGETAYVHRGFDWLFTVEANWWRPTDSTQRVENLLEWQRNFYDDANRRTRAVGAFQNFPDPSLPDWQQAYYGDNYKRLSEIKAKVDPQMLFLFQQAVRPA